MFWCKTLTVIAVIAAISCIISGVVVDAQTSREFQIRKRTEEEKRTEQTQLDGVTPLSIPLWPRPVSVTTGQGSMSVVNAQQFTWLSNVNHEVINSAFQRYTNFIFYLDNDDEDNNNNNNLKKKKDYSFKNNHYHNQKPPSFASRHQLPFLSGLNVTVLDTNNVELQLGVDESYNLTVSQDNPYAQLQSVTIWGALRGIETFSQLVTPSSSASSSSSSSYYQVLHTPIRIEDYPRFPWRGLLIDTSRHFLSVGKILEIIDALSFNKMNTLHWHMVDSQSFPVEIISYPLLHEKGAWAPNAVYTQSDIQKVVHYAYMRGVRVVPEFDMPGHTASWGFGYPEIIAQCPLYTDTMNTWYWTMDPSNPLTYKVINAVLAEMSALFPDKFMHLGGDEVVYNCWQNDSSLSEWMKQNSLSTYDEVEAYFADAVGRIYPKYGKSLVCWQELVLNNPNIKLPPETTVATAYASRASLYQIVKAGYRGILSAGWYLDQMNPGNNWHYEWEDVWLDFYTNEPFLDPTSGRDYDYTPAEQAQILGGEACMWGEQVDDTNFNSRVWPRAAAAAERLWSPREYNSTAEAASRLGNHRCNMVRRGIRAGPIYPDYCDAVYNYNNNHNHNQQQQQLQQQQQQHEVSVSAILTKNKSKNRPSPSPSPPPARPRPTTTTTTSTKRTNTNPTPLN